jgi:L-glyceraldehyde 3-phosphate reductase
MALAWVMKDNVCTSVLIGASKPEQILENIGIIKRKPFTDEELKLIDEAVK